MRIPKAKERFESCPVISCHAGPRGHRVLAQFPNEPRSLGAATTDGGLASYRVRGKESRSPGLSPAATAAIDAAQAYHPPSALTATGFRTHCLTNYWPAPHPVHCGTIAWLEAPVIRHPPVVRRRSVMERGSGGRLSIRRFE